MFYFTASPVALLRSPRALSSAVRVFPSPQHRRIFLFRSIRSVSLTHAVIISFYVTLKSERERERDRARERERERSCERARACVSLLIHSKQ